jgi:hypothetical protein
MAKRVVVLARKATGRPPRSGRSSAAAAILPDDVFGLDRAAEHSVGDSEETCPVLHKVSNSLFRECVVGDGSTCMIVRYPFRR